jgi:hypothetical protein
MHEFTAQIYSFCSFLCVSDERIRDLCMNMAANEFTSSGSPNESAVRENSGYLAPGLVNLIQSPRHSASKYANA